MNIYVVGCCKQCGSVSALTPSSSPSASSFTAATKICDQHYDQVGDKPDVIGTHTLINIDQDQNSRHENAKQNVGPLRNGILRIDIEEKINEEYDTRKK